MTDICEHDNCSSEATKTISLNDSTATYVRHLCNVHVDYVIRECGFERSMMYACVWRLTQNILNHWFFSKKINPATKKSVAGDKMASLLVLIDFLHEHYCYTFV